MKPIKKVLIPIDFSSNAKKIFLSGVEMAKQFDAQIHILYVAQTLQNYEGFFVPHRPISELEGELVQGAERKMEAFLAENQGAVRCQSKVLLGDVAEEIVNYARQENIDMIIMGTHGYKGLERALFGSVAEKVVKTARCPVLTINPYR
jgi:nucleotide-binding universal stress UspA family protein